MRAVGKVLAATAVLLPAATALMAVHPVEAAAPQGFSSFGLTVTAAAARTEGVVGASGGLVTLDAGAAFTTSRLDGGPSSYALAAPVEPGTLARTLVGTVNTDAGQTVLTVPDAESAYPGRGSASTQYADPVAAGPLSATPGTASSSASAQRAQASTTTSAFGVDPAATATALRGESLLTGDSDTGRGEAQGTSRVGAVTVAGTLVLHDVVGTARVVVTGGHPVSTASLTIGSATVAGVPVTIDQDGVHAAGQSGGLGPVQDAQDQVDAALSQAGLSVRTITVSHMVDGRTGYADTGGLVVKVATPDLPGGVAANALTLTFGKVTVTGTSTAQEPLLPVVVPPVVGQPGTPGSSTTTTVTSAGPPPVSGVVGGSQPSPVLASHGRQVLVAGHRLSAAAALAAFGVWQLLTLSTTTLYAVIDRRRRLEEAP